MISYTFVRLQAADRGAGISERQGNYMVHKHLGDPWPFGDPGSQNGSDMAHQHFCNFRVIMEGPGTSQNQGSAMFNKHFCDAGVPFREPASHNIKGTSRITSIARPEPLGILMVTNGLLCPG